MALKENLVDIRGRIDRACEKAGRDPSSVQLIAITKTVSAEVIRQAYDLGLRHFGENRLQEALPKIESLPSDIVWHFVGKLQSNKARRAAERFDAIHTIESPSQVREIAKAGRQIDALIEVNVAREPQKAGIFPESLDALHQQVLECNCVRFRGLMTVGPVTPDPEMSRPVFRSLAELGRRIGAEWLSMGMSADYDVAIQEGSTHVRIGTALFGGRA